MLKEIVVRLHKNFEDFVHEDGGVEFWFARGVDASGFARIRSRGDAALFGGHDTADIKRRLGVKPARPLADFLPAVTIKAKDLANEMTNFNVKKDVAMQGEASIMHEHEKNNAHVRETLVKSGIHPESLPRLKKV